MSEKDWSERSLQEQKESINKYFSKEIIYSIMEERSPIFAPPSNDKPFNPSSGIPYTGLNGLILDIKQIDGKYSTNQWVSLADARFLGAKPEELTEVLEKAQRGEIKTAKVAFLKTTELTPKYKLDENGEKIPLLDFDGTHRYNKNGELLYQYEMVEQRDENGNVKINPETNQPYMQVVNERKEINPRFETEFLFNIDEFKTISDKRLKPINKEFEAKKERFYIGRAGELRDQYLIVNELQLLPQTIETIKNYINMKNIGKANEFAPSIPQEIARDNAKDSQFISQEAPQVQQTQEQTQENKKGQKAQKTGGRGGR